jgi:hypothetical protein
VGAGFGVNLCLANKRYDLLIRSYFFSTAKKVPVECIDVSLHGHPRGYALDQHDKARVVLLCPSARTFLFYSEKSTGGI